MKYFILFLLYTISFNVNASILSLYNIEYTTYYDTYFKSPVMVIYDSTNIDENISRANYFYNDKRIPLESQPNYNSYKYSGFDRGHLFPSDYTTTFESSKESNYYSNTVPQTIRLNRGVWKSLENYTHTKIKARVFTGPIYKDCKVNIKLIDQNNNGVPVPEYTFKIILYDNIIESYLIPNNVNLSLDEDYKNYKVTIEEINSKLCNGLTVLK
ncbi:MAG: endonuclease [Bacteriophage sp.]|nr:MAG: endonuclease [Bacteriophage sp.]